jgi:hypothetical protein
MLDRSIRTRLGLLGLQGLLLPGLVVLCTAPAALATPPDHAPAHGYRAKHGDTKAEKRDADQKSGIEVVYDSERGIHVGVHLPDVFFLDGRYYRETNEGRWEVSATGDGDWTVSASSQVPEKVVKARRAQPGPAKRAKGSEKRR